MRIDTDVSGERLETEILEKRVDKLTSHLVIALILIPLVTIGLLGYGYYRLDTSLKLLANIGSDQVNTLSSELEQKLFQVSAQSETLLNRIGENRKAIDSLKRELEGRIASERRSGKDLAQRVGILQKDIATQKSLIEKQQKATGRDFNALADRMEKLATELASEATARDQALVTVNAERKALQTRLDAMAAPLNDLTGQVSRLQKEMATVETRTRSTSKAELAAVEKRFTDRLRQLKVSVEALTLQGDSGASETDAAPIAEQNLAN